MAIETYSQLQLDPLPQSQVPNAPKRKLDPQFGRIVSGVDINNLTQEELDAIHDALYRHSLLVFPHSRTYVTPEAQYKLTQSFDPDARGYGHGKERQKQSILHPDLKTLPMQREVQLIGNGLVKEHEGLEDAQLKHPHHRTFHKSPVSDADEAKGITRFYRWHIDAALYDLSPPRVTTLYGLEVPRGSPQVVRYDDGTGDELPVPLGTTAFISGAQMFDELDPSHRSLAARMTVCYAPHPYVWMAPSRSNSVGLGMETEGKELPLEQLPSWSQDKVKRLPACWKNPVTGRLHLQIHPSAVQELIIAPHSTSSLYPKGAHITDLAEVRRIVYELQRPAIAPAKIYAHDWSQGDFCLFHNQGVLHSVVGAFKPEEVRMFHQCNLAASSDPTGPTEDDLRTILTETSP